MRRPLATLGMVVAGGVLGTAARAAIVLPLGAPASPLVLPAVTLVVNVVGSFALGWLVGRIDDRRPVLRAFVGTGVLGGFTTYSAFAYQTVSLGGAAPVLGALLVIASLLVGLLAAAAGLRAGRRDPREIEPPEDAE